MVRISPLREREPITDDMDMPFPDNGGGGGYGYGCACSKGGSSEYNYGSASAWEPYGDCMCQCSYGTANHSANYGLGYKK